jgi:hypothetical protein
MKARPSTPASSVLQGVPRPRVSASAPRLPKAEPQIREAGGIKSWAGRFWRRYLKLSVSAEPLLSTVWIHGQCIDVSIYDRDWPESYRY